MPRITFILNHDCISDEVDADTTVLRYLRERRGLTGTKEVCNEGDCGACTVAVGERFGEVVRYRPMNSCLTPAVRMHQRHIVTVEGLAEDDVLHPVQQAMLDHHAVQCGYCTAGVVMALFCLFANNPAPSNDEIELALDGTLCRCTGYASIRTAVNAVSAMLGEARAGRSSRPAYFAGILDGLRKIGSVPEDEQVFRSYEMPESLNEVFRLLRDGQSPGKATIFGGGTDLVTAANMKGARYERIVDLSRVEELRTVALKSGALIVGGSVTLSELLESEQLRRSYPALKSALEQMCSAQVRSTATLAGNVATASPIADTVPVLMVYDATVVLRSEKSERRLKISQFLKGYRKTDLRAGEVIAAIEIPETDRWVRFEKTGKRRALDIATVNSALAIRLDGDRIVDAKLAYGGVAPTAIEMPEVSAMLRGQRLSEALVLDAAQAAVKSVSPIDDVRGSADVRRLLVRNHLIKHFARLSDDLKLNLFARTGAVA